MDQVGHGVRKMSKKSEIKSALADAMKRGLSDVEMAKELGEASAAGIRRLKSQFGLTDAKKWRCSNCRFEMMSVERPKCQRHSIHMVPFSDYEKSNREGGLWMEEVIDE